MRWLLVVLVIANILLCLYHVNRGEIVSDDVAGLQVAPRGTDIRLLSETKPLERREHAHVADSGCVYLGGFDDEAEALAVEQRLLSLDIEAEVAPMEESAGVDYWVYLPPLVSRQASLRQLRELQSRNVDSYIITVGDLSNGISLGIFSKRDTAESVASRLRAIDYAPSIRELPRSHQRYWVRLSHHGEPVLRDGLLVELMRSFPAMEHRQMPCSAIATSD